MFKKKSIYIIGIVIFTLILIADLAIYFMPGTGGMGNRPSMDIRTSDAQRADGEMPGGFSMPENGEMPEGFGGGNFNFENFSGEVPEGFDSSNFNPENFSGEAPEGFSMPANGEMPEGFDSSDFFGGGRGNTGALATIKKAFIPILIICILGDGVCIFMLVRISKKKQNFPNESLNEKAPEEETDSDNPPRKDKTNTYLGIVAGVLALSVLISSLSSGSGTASRETEKAIIEESVAVGNIVSTFSGSGTLQSSEATETQFPVSVKVTSYTVKSGDTVKKGDVIAKVNKESVLNAVYEVQKLIDEMDEEIAEVKDDTLDSEITARADGLVKEVYVEAGDSVSEVMYNKGTLILISLGGSMSVEIESEESVKVGQSVTVTLSDKSEIEGKVQQIKNGKITVTTTDEKPSQGEKATVYTKKGVKLGSGKIEVTSPLKVTAFTGTAEKVYVEKGDKVSIGDTLLILEDTSDRARYEQLLRERENMTTLISSLSEIYKDGTVKAKQSGIVSELSDDIGYTELSQTKSKASSAQNLSVTSKAKPKVMALSLSSESFGETTSSAEESITESPSSTEPITEAPTTSAEETTALPETTKPENETTAPSTSGNQQETTLPNDVPSIPDGSNTPPTSGNESGFTPPTQQQADGVYAGKISKVTYGALIVSISEKDMTGKNISALQKMKDAEFTVMKQYAPTSNTAVYMYKDGKQIKSTVNAIQAGDKVYLYVKNGELTQIDYIPGDGTANDVESTFPEGTMPGGTPSQDTNSKTTTPEGTVPEWGGSIPEGMTGGSMQMPSVGSGYTGQQTESEEEEETIYSIEKFSLCAITPAETMSVEISVDELDILSLAVGQQATVTLDALPGQSTSGSVKKIIPIGTLEDGGSTKYTAVISIPRSEEMLDGMNASVNIEVGKSENVLTIPAAAVYEDGNRTFVYTDTTGKDGELRASVDITTGASDGEIIEVVSGLNEGDSIYYTYADSIVYRTGR